MIRVTFGECKYINYSNKVMEFKDYHAYRNFIENCSFAYTVTQSIIKFEKQVKDLTLEELDSVALHLHPYTTQIDHHPGRVLITYLGWDGVDYASEAEYIDTLDFNEYVDITYLIKGE